MVFIHAAWKVVLELAPWLMLGVAVAGMLHAVLPRDFVRRHLGGPGRVGRAVLLGVPLPLCSCGVIPAGLGLKKDGASDGASIGFLIATPQTGVDSFFVSGSLLGWPFAAFKVASAALLGWVGGRLVDATGAVASGAPPDIDETRDATRLRAPESRALEFRAPESRAPESRAPESRAPGFRAGMAHGLDVLRSIWRWILVGIVVSAALTTLVPAEALQRFAQIGGGWLAPLAILALSVPLYVCATASVPIAAALVAGGFPPGAALVFLMAGPATNVATLGAVKSAFGARVLAIYLSTIVIGSLFLAWAFDFVIAPGLPAAAVGHVHEAGLISILCGIVLLAFMGYFAIESVMARAAGSAQMQSATVMVEVEGLTCGGCVRKLEGALEALDGVEATRVDRKDGSVRGTAMVQGPVDAETVRHAVVGAGFTVVDAH